MPYTSVDSSGNVIQHGRKAPALVVDLDGTVRFCKDDPEGFINEAEDVALYDGVEGVLWKHRDNGSLILGASNQGGVAFGFKTPQDFMAELDAMDELWERGNPFHIIKACYHHAEGDVVPYNARSLLRKPAYGMLALMELEAFREGYIIDWDESLFVGDRQEDRTCAEAAGIDFEWADSFFGREAT